MFRKGGNKLEYKVKENMGKKKSNENNKEEEGVVYRVSYKNDVEYERISNNAIARHVGEFNLEIDWEKTICLEEEKRLIPKKILESVYI